MCTRTEALLQCDQWQTTEQLSDHDRRNGIRVARVLLSCTCSSQHATLSSQHAAVIPAAIVRARHYAQHESVCVIWDETCASVLASCTLCKSTKESCHVVDVHVQRRSAATRLTSKTRSVHNLCDVCVRPSTANVPNNGQHSRCVTATQQTYLVELELAMGTVRTCTRGRQSDFRLRTLV